MRHVVGRVNAPLVPGGGRAGLSFDAVEDAGSRRFILGEAMSIRARRGVREP